MKIFIDESGSFSPDIKKEHSISCLTALIIPEILEEQIFQKFNLWKSHISSDKKNKNGEIKGSSLSENEISSFFFMLSGFDIISESICVDMGGVSDLDVDNYQELLSKNFSSSNTGLKINSSFNKEIIQSFSKNLFVQSYCTYHLLDQALGVLLSYYAQRFPLELGDFIWIFDSKNTKITEYETAIECLVKPFLQWINHHNKRPGILNGEDYSAFEKYYISKDDIIDSYKTDAHEKSIFYNINEIMKEIQFVESHKSSGLQIVDIISKCTRRAMIGNLQFDGWKFYPSIFVRRNDFPPIKSFSFISEKKCTIESAINFLNYISSHGKQMLVPTHLREVVKKNKKGYLKWPYRESIDGRKRIVLEYY